jgi:hypothetical protein
MRAAGTAQCDSVRDEIEGEDSEGGTGGVCECCCERRAHSQPDPEGEGPTLVSV